MPPLWPTGSSSGWLPSIPARNFSASPSDSTSRWTPCPPRYASRPARHHPRVWIWRSPSEHQWDFNPRDYVAAQRTLRLLLTSAPRSGRLSAASVANATRRRSPGVSSAAFCAPSPNLRFAPLMDMDFAVSCPLVRRWRLVSGSCPSTRTFAPCFFQTPPRDGGPCIITRPSPPSGWPKDFHLQAAAHAQHTTKGPDAVTLT